MRDPKSLIEKANRCLISAKNLLEDHDADGACNRAYYGMFNAAHAALILIKAPVPEHIAKTHSGLIRAFAKYLVSEGPISKEVFRYFKNGEETRLIADYDDIYISVEETSIILKEAGAFVSAVEKTFATELSKSKEES